ncbi:MAG: hypothetical protein LBB22_02045, partial [Treponema sp.]|nr:hypothetical protein [Treponema sp.]
AGRDEEGAALIEKTLLEREALSSQVLSRLSLVLLHARSAGVEVPVFAVLTPARRDGGAAAAFTQSYFCGAKSCALMLLPPPSAGGGGMTRIKTSRQVLRGARAAA